MGHEQRIFWQELLARSHDDFDADTDFNSHFFPDTRVALGFVCLWALADAVGYAEQRNTVDIDYSTDNGATWIRIATQAPDTGWYLVDRARPCYDDGEGANTRP